jgi:CheY-like chemotaxis protein/HPt (histidine-containing phosphotransfer) domain-containing protein
VGKGSRFWFHLPLKKSHTTLPCRVTPIQLLSLRKIPLILAIEHQKFSEVLQEQCVAWGINAKLVTSVAEIRQLLRLIPKHRHLLLLDAPLLEVLSTAEKLQLQQELSQHSVHVAVLNQWEAEHSSVEIGEYALNKPVMPSKLLECLLLLAGVVTKETLLTATVHEAAAVNPQQTYRILLAEDNVINQEVVCEMLRQLGCEIRVANNGKQALEYLQQADFDLIFMDCHMPELDGFGATQAIRALERGTNRHIPIVALTADAMQDNRELCLAAGMDDYLAKPMKMKELQEVLNRHLSRESPPLQFACPPAPPIPPPVATPFDEFPVLSTATLENLRVQMKGRGIRWLIDLYLRELPNYVNNLKQAARTQDGQQIYLAAHKFKGSCANLGLIYLTQFCLKLEQLGKQNEILEATQLIEEILPKAVAQATEALQLEE